MVAILFVYSALWITWARCMSAALILRTSTVELHNTTAMIASVLSSANISSWERSRSHSRKKSNR